MGENFLLWLQQFSNGAFDAFFGVITHMGAESFYLIWIPIIYWCVNKAVGIRMALIMSVSAFTNTALKDFFHTSRPDPTRVRVLLAETGPGSSFPSGHAQGTTTFWFTLVREFSKRWLVLVSCVVVLLVAVSRMYLGLHYPVDVVGGFIIGLVFAITGVAFLKKFAEPFCRLALPVQFLAALILPLVLLVFNHSESALHVIGNMVGFSIGAIIEREWIRFRVKEALAKQLIKVVLGLAILFGVRMGLKAVFPAGDFYEFLRYSLIGLSGAAIVPFLFRKSSLTMEQDPALRA